MKKYTCTLSSYILLSTFYKNMKCGWEITHKTDMRFLIM